MRRRKRVGVDVDDTVADFEAVVATVYRRMFGEPMPERRQWEIGHLVPVRQRDRFWEAVGRYGAHRDMLPLPHARSGILLLASIADVYFVTSPLLTDPHWMAERVEWLAKHFDTPPSRIQFQHDKHTFAGDIFVDDRPDNVDAWAREHDAGIACLWLRNYNAGHDFRDLNYRVIRTESWNAIHRLAGGQ